jgi:hypothetical protein
MVLSRSRTAEPTLTTERWFLSVCYRDPLLTSTDHSGLSRRALRMGATAVSKYPLPTTQLQASMVQALGLREAPRRTG